MEYKSLEGFLGSYGLTLDDYKQALLVSNKSPFDPDDLLVLESRSELGYNSFNTEFLFDKTLVWSRTKEGRSKWDEVHYAFVRFFKSIKNNQEPLYIREADVPGAYQRYKPEELSEIHGYSTQCTLDEL